MKKCTECKEMLVMDNFGICSRNRDGRLFKCKECNKKVLLKYSRSIPGVITEIYKAQVARSTKRWKNRPEYTKQWLTSWLNSQPNFKVLFHSWEVSGYLKELKPSIDRIDNDIPYTKSNIQLMTWQDNKDKASKDIRNVILIHGNKPQRGVIQFTKDMTYINSYASLSNAERATGVNHSSIANCCRLGRKYAGNYIWRYKDD